MNSVIVKDKTFRPFLAAEEIQKRVAEIGARISQDLEGKNPLFLAILNGSYVFAADLLRHITTPCEISFIRVSSYSGMESTGKLTEVIGLKENIEGRTVVIVEDIIDSGFTMEGLVNSLKAKNPADLRICTLLTKPGNMKVDLDIPYCAFEIPNDFIVGYGLDYDGYGRNLPAIYVVE
ncbi:MAG: hypoxanthine phosphoribosyltransferase [Bacteroidales bacterium]|nr:hypoxanthine phosphoribosyltransferase [Bacteroidales bacterium]